MVNETRRQGGYLFEGGSWRLLGVLFVVFAVSTLNLWFLKAPLFDFGAGVFGGPGRELLDNSNNTAFAAVESLFGPETGSGEINNLLIPGKSEAFLVNPGSFLGGDLTQKGSYLIYKVKAGDTLSKISEDFNVSLETIKAANPVLKSKLSPGTEVIILPVSGSLYSVSEGDTVESIAEDFSIDTARLIAVNGFSSEADLKPGSDIVIPDVKPKKNLASLSVSGGASLPNLAGYFVFPLPKNSLNWGKLHPDNAVDIANACGTSIYASADGLVADTGSALDWNNGYGGYLRVEHANGTETLYAHVGKIIAEKGRLVSKGETIAEVGKTGNVHGATGCHLHFEVRGARNPFVK